MKYLVSYGKYKQSINFSSYVPTSLENSPQVFFLASANANILKTLARNIYQSLETVDLKRFIPLHCCHNHRNICSKIVLLPDIFIILPSPLSHPLQHVK